MMTFEEGGKTGPTTRSLGVSSGEFRAVQRDTQSLVPALVATPTIESPTVPQPNLHYVFDDPNDGEPGRDRIFVHLMWELGLALALVGAGIALVNETPGALAGESLRILMLTASLVGLLAVASAVSLRAGVPNLAVGGIAVFAGWWVAEHSATAWGAATAAVIGFSAAIGLVVGLLTVGLHVPSWAVGLAAAVALAGWVGTRDAVSGRLGYDPVPDAYVWFGVLAAASIVACLIGLHPGIRRGFGRFRAVADPARRRTRAGAVIAVAATVASSVIAGLGGALGAVTRPATQPGSAVQEAVLLTALGLGAALLGGTSAYGRRGGIFGTVLAASLLTVTLTWAAAAYPSWPAPVVIAAAILVGLGATRLVERFGRPVLLPSPDDDETWGPRVTSLTSSAPWRPGPTPAGGLWSSDEGWGAPPR